MRYFGVRLMSATHLFTGMIILCYLCTAWWCSWTVLSVWTRVPRRRGGGSREVRNYLQDLGRSFSICRCVRRKVCGGEEDGVSCLNNVSKTGISWTLDPGRWDRYVVPKRRFLTNLRCITSQKTEEFRELYWAAVWPSSGPCVQNATATHHGGLLNLMHSLMLWRLCSVWRTKKSPCSAPRTALNG